MHARAPGPATARPVVENRRGLGSRRPRSRAPRCAGALRAAPCARQARLDRRRLCSRLAPRPRPQRLGCRDRRAAERSPANLSARDPDWSGARNDHGGQQRASLRGDHVARRGPLLGRKAARLGDLRERHRCRSRAAGFHGQRDGRRPARWHAHRSIRRPAGPRARSPPCRWGTAATLRGGRLACSSRRPFRGHTRADARCRDRGRNSSDSRHLPQGGRRAGARRVDEDDEGSLPLSGIRGYASDRDPRSHLSGAAGGSGYGAESLARLRCLAARARVHGRVPP